MLHAPPWWDGSENDDEEEEEEGGEEEELQYSLKAPWERDEAREPTTHAEDHWE